ncbi:hypothetical protein AB0K21_37190 [Streptosporangium sp. NPDC049248]|uniref:hypothetical protein n=1 Tax=Streptosporangium sp. NPDC049248 TaxID=3155651 RepID=UPI003425657C
MPAAVVAISDRLLEEPAVDVPRTRSFRTDDRLEVLRTPDLAGSAVRAVREALGHEGSVAVIATDAALGEPVTALRAEGVEVATLDDIAPAARVTAVPATMAKGLEYHHVVVAEPAEIAETEPRGLNRLYVVPTRAVSRLDVLHTRPLPAWLAPPAGVQG